MKNRILINVYVPSIDESYDIWAPFTDNFGIIAEAICKSINEFTDGAFNYDNGYVFIDPDTSLPYDLNSSLKDTDIRNDKKIILL